MNDKSKKSVKYFFLIAGFYPSHYMKYPTSTRVRNPDLSCIRCSPAVWALAEQQQEIQSDYHCGIKQLYLLHSKQKDNTVSKSGLRRSRDRTSAKLILILICKWSDLFSLIRPQNLEEDPYDDWSPDPDTDQYERDTRRV